MKKQILLVVSILLLGFSIASAQTIPKTISGGVVNGKARNLPTPEYPAAAKAVRASGTVNVQVTIDEDGNVSSANAVSGHPLLRSAAVDAAFQAKFAPTQLSGQAVKVTGVIVYNFSPSQTFIIADAPPNQGSVRTMSDSAMTEQSQLNSSVKTISGGVINGKARNLVVPAYPAAAKAVGASGAVNVQVTIDEDGNVSSANAVSGHPLLRTAAEQAAWASKFSPTLLQGQPVRVTGIIVYNFTTGDSVMNKSSWFKTGFDLANIQYNSSQINLNVSSVGKVFPADWTAENQQLQRLEEIKRSETSNASQLVVITGKNVEKRPDGTTVETITTEKPVKFGSSASPELIAATRSLIASLQSRLGSDALNYWQFNTGLRLSEALAKSENANEKQSASIALRQQIQSAPNGVSPEYLADLQILMEFVEKQNPTMEDRVKVSQVLRKLF